MPSTPVSSETPPASQPAVPFNHYLFRFRALEQVRLPRYSGSAWRGALGHALKRTVCVTREPECAPCLLYHACAYAWVFETPPPPDTEKMRRYNAVPHPFVLRPPPESSVLEQGDPFELGLILIGDGDRQFPYLLHALMRAANEGIGAQRGKLELLGVTCPAPDGGEREVYRPGGQIDRQAPQPASVPPLPEEPIRLTFLTPLRLRREGHYLGPRDIGFRDLFGSLLRRVSMLSYFHCGQPLETDFAGLNVSAANIPIVRSTLRWHEWTRYSSRQDTAVQMGGMVGELWLEPSGMDAFWPYLWQGQWLHCGKGTAMGLGRYQIDQG